MADTNNKIIRQISTDSSSTYDIAAKYLTDASGNYLTYASIHDEIDSVQNDLNDKYDELVGIAQGVIDTYVIPTSNQDIEGDIVGSDLHTTDEISVATLLSLVVPENKSGKFKVGDIILMEAESTDGKKAFDRWVSWVSEDGVQVKLTVLESQVAKHYHEVDTITDVSRTISSAKALTSATPTPTTATMATVGTEVENVLTGGSGYVVTNIGWDKNDGSCDHNLTIELSTTSSSDAVGHTHTVNSHSHTVSFTPTAIVSQNVSAYTLLSTSTYTPHTHTIVSAAGLPSNDTAIEYVYQGGKTETFIKELKEISESTGVNASGLVTKQNSDGVKTSEQTSEDSIGTAVLTTSSGSHTHSLSAETAKVITSAIVATKVLTSVAVDFEPNIATNVVTSWICSVSDGVLNFNSSSTTQDKGNVTVTTDSFSQSVSYASAAVTGTAKSNGAHSHGFSHTHTIPSHTHDIEEHTHTYIKTIVSTSGSAYTSLSTSSYTPHKHDINVNAANVMTSDTSSEFTYVYDGMTTDVVQTLKSSSFDGFTVSESNPNTSTVYQKITGDIAAPAITFSSKLLSTVNIIPAKDSEEKPIRSITYDSTNFLTDVTITTSSGTINTKINSGGTPS